MQNNNVCKTCQHEYHYHEHFSGAGFQLKEITYCFEWVNKERCKCEQFISMNSLEYWKWLVQKRVQGIR